jgi:hypothetical protein
MLIIAFSVSYRNQLKLIAETIAQDQKETLLKEKTNKHVRQR